ncbi:hypothetical protein OE88DRAFT_1658820 [Heliocybe sulcata]|uniref:Uncharacterized protein n=1 Tax=Heliocybe sulcata TaxID=5364 RepID=A0A5C3N7N1_9AGAM|nr:hypothetical protein OE88DRAFT_1658820 [Heliocybe sulcata]
MNASRVCLHSVLALCCLAIVWLTNFSRILLLAALVVIPLTLRFEMVFNFTFSLAVPGIPNPFSAIQRQASPPALSRPDMPRALSRKDVGPRQRQLPSPAASDPSLPLNRKRGWVPALAEPSQAPADQSSTSGYLGTPEKYRDMAQSKGDEAEVEGMVEELAPTKRRRTLAGSIVSTALSAALIGTAVGLTVYRLWRDRGREPEQLPPPPPYQERDWVPVPPPKSAEATSVEAAAPTPHSPRRPRHAASRRAAGRRRRTPHRTRIQHVSTRSSSPSWQPELDSRFDFTLHEEPQAEPVAESEVDVDAEMDWIGGKISQLIQEGKKALGKEVVVMSDAQEDEEDDGNGDWEEEAGPSTASRRDSMRRSKRPRGIHPPAYFSGSASTSSSPRANQFERGRSRDMSSMSARGVSMESERSHFQEDSNAWESPELRESMQRAREMYLSRRS